MSKRVSAEDAIAQVPDDATLTTAGDNRFVETGSQTTPTL